MTKEGVLSVGAIAGYQKAMMKYKLNKQAQQISQIINASIKYNSSLTLTTDIKSVTEFFVKLGETPTEMIKASDKNHVYDSFNNKILIESFINSANTNRTYICLF